MQIMRQYTDPRQCAMLTQNTAIMPGNEPTGTLADVRPTTAAHVSIHCWFESHMSICIGFTTVKVPDRALSEALTGPCTSQS